MSASHPETLDNLFITSARANFAHCQRQVPRILTTLFRYWRNASGVLIFFCVVRAVAVITWRAPYPEWSATLPSRLPANSLQKCTSASRDFIGKFREVSLTFSEARADCLIAMTQSARLAGLLLAQSISLSTCCTIRSATLAEFFAASASRMPKCSSCST